MCRSLRPKLARTIMYADYPAEQLYRAMKITWLGLPYTQTIPRQAIGALVMHEGLFVIKHE